MRKILNRCINAKVKNTQTRTILNYQYLLVHWQKYNSIKVPMKYIKVRYLKVTKFTYKRGNKIELEVTVSKDDILDTYCVSFKDGDELVFVDIDDSTISIHRYGDTCREDVFNTIYSCLNVFFDDLIDTNINARALKFLREISKYGLVLSSFIEFRY